MESTYVICFLKSGLNCIPTIHSAKLCGTREEKTRRKVLKVAKMKDANYGCKDEGQSVD